MEEQEKVTVKAVDNTDPSPTSQEKEVQVLEKAIESGEVDAQYGLQDDGVFKIDLDKDPNTKEKDAIQERKTKEIPVGERTGDSKEVVEKVRVKSSEKNTETKQEEVAETSGPLELIVEDETTIEEPKKEEVKLQKEEPKEDARVLPENIDKLVSFMEETGGTVSDFVELNKDISKYDNTSLLREYYNKTKPHLDSSDVEFLLGKNFGYDEDADDPSEVKAKQLAFKEELYNAQKHFKTSKEQYYADLKLSKQNDIAPEYKEAYEYHNTQKQIQEENKKIHEDFLNKTNDVFSDDFKGFDFSVGKSKYRFKVENPNDVKEFQSDIDNFAFEYFSKDGKVNNVKGYHKALFAGRNADKIATHFYDQGRADAIKEQAKLSKNIDMSPRADNTSVINSNGQKVKVVSGNDSSKLRIKWK